MFIALLLFSLMTSKVFSDPLPVKAQMVWFNSSDPRAMDITSIFYRKYGQDYLYDRRDTRSPLPDCSTSGTLKLDRCLVCVEEQQVIAKCLLTRPSADLVFETGASHLLFDRMQTPFALPTTATPTTTPSTTATPTTTPTTTTPPPSGLSGGYIALIVLALLALLVGAGGVAAFICRKKIKSWVNARLRRSHSPVPPKDLEMEMPVSNGKHLANGAPVDPPVPDTDRPESDPKV